MCCNITCSTWKHTDLDIQRHVSRKYEVKKCWFGVPWLPVSKTETLGPINGEGLLHVEQYITICSHPRMVGKTGSKLLQHDILCVSHKTWYWWLLLAWQGNHDMQLVLDTYSCVVYMCKFMTKAWNGMRLLLSEACRETKAEIPH